jgi:hypothetical protein
MQYAARKGQHPYLPGLSNMHDYIRGRSSYRYEQSAVAAIHLVGLVKKWTSRLFDFSLLLGLGQFYQERESTPSAHRGHDTPVPLDDWILDTSTEVLMWSVDGLSQAWHSSLLHCIRVIRCLTMVYDTNHSKRRLPYAIVLLRPY